MKEDKLVQDWLSNEVSADEIAEMERLIAFTENLTVPEKKTKSEAWNDVLGKINEESTDNEVILIPEKQTSRKWIAWVASIAALFLVGYFSMQETPEPSIYSTELADNLTHTLPDNSIVTMNAQSSISLMEENWATERTLRLNGEAFFEVERGSKFTVATDLGEISVLGTSFNVFVRGEELVVSTFSGKVRVADKDQEVVLEKGDQLTYVPNENVWTVSNFNKNETATWRTGAFYFDTTPLPKVIGELERQFDIKFNVNTDLSNRFYSGYFSKTNLTEALQLVFVPMGLTAEVDGNQVNVQ